MAKSSVTPLLVLDGESEEITSSLLPEDIIVDILSRLPIKSILQFRCVCKHWYSNLLRDPSLVKIYIKNSIESDKFNVFSIKDGREFSMLIRKPSSSLTTFEDDSFEPMNVIDLPFKSQLVRNPNLWIHTHGSCNGLILMKRYIVGVGYAQDINPILWNPTTKEFKEIVIDKDVDYGQQYDPSTIKPNYGLGYNCDTNDYKIVKVELVYSSHNLLVCVGSGVQVYSLGSNSWKTLPGTVPYEILHHDNEFVNGALHWIANTCPVSTTGPLSILIVSFDIRGEIFREVPLTVQVGELFSYFWATLGVLGGCLCVVFCGYFEFEVWVMKDRDVGESWTKLFVAQHPVKRPRLCSMKLQWEFQNGKLLFTAESVNGKDIYFVIYDSVSHKCEVHDTYRIPGNNYCTKTYVESLVPISGTYAGREQDDPILQKQAVSKYLKDVDLSYAAVTSLVVCSFVAVIFLVMHLSSLLMHLF
ncbi:F-box/kelch-repeat protein At3g06240-like [Papaver somniferum]|uniref:F-box/kelch-repeat protein At3g06240-like n=1 Tax=Papaver somniferum TaxID=3469 RepID=UPI000E704F31|nr:F-box/kelch-repeat protein At3g06240-like [Papaver somniferum]XP_026439068.1 F-box/kelch-repeat protein At3g06240-like [Papaver somniferum]